MPVSCLQFFYSRLLAMTPPLQHLVVYLPRGTPEVQYIQRFVTDSFPSLPAVVTAGCLDTWEFPQAKNFRLDVYTKHVESIVSYSTMWGTRPASHENKNLSLNQKKSFLIKWCCLCIKYNTAATTRQSGWGWYRHQTPFSWSLNFSSVRRSLKNRVTVRSSCSDRTPDGSQS